MTGSASRAPRSEVLSDDKYAAVVEKVELRLRLVINNFWHTEQSASQAVRNCLVGPLRDAFELAASSSGASEASVRSVVPRHGSRHGAESFGIKRDVGLGTLACEVFVTNASRLLRKPHAAKVGSTQLWWQKIPVHLRHVVLPMHVLSRTMAVIQQIPAQDFRDEARRQLTSAAARFLVEHGRPNEAEMYFATVFAANDLQDFLRPLADLENPMAGYMMGLAFRHCVSLLEASEDMEKAAAVLAPLYNCVETHGWRTSQEPFDVFFACFSLVPRWVCGEVSNSPKSPPSSDAVSAFDVDLAVIVRLASYEGYLCGKPGSSARRRTSLTPDLTVDHRWISGQCLDAIERFGRAKMQDALPRTTKEIIALLVSLLLSRRMLQLEQAGPEEAARLKQREHCCNYLLTSDRRKRRCREVEEGGLGPAEEQQRWRRTSLSMIKPHSDCERIADLLRLLYDRRETPSHPSFEALERAYIEDEDEAVDDPRPLVFRGFEHLPFPNDTIILFNCLAVLSEMELYRAEAELGLSLQRAWDEQTELTPSAREYFACGLLSHRADIADEYEGCEDHMQRWNRRCLVSQIIADRVALAESKAIAQEQALAEQQSEEDALDEGEVSEVSPRKGTPKWRYEPLLDQWVSGPDAATTSEGSNQRLAAANFPPAPSSPDPLTQTSPFGSPGGTMAECDSDDSDAESCVSRLISAGPSLNHNPYKKAIEAESSRLKRRRTSGTLNGDDADTADTEQDFGVDEDHDDDDDDLDLFKRRTPNAKRARRPPKRYGSDEQDRRSRRARTAGK
ncbi:hypothetical protein V8E36_000766 [Tilletia maclaganii]